MTNTFIKSETQVPKYLHIYQDILTQIQNGSLKPGDRLPSFAELRITYDAMPATVDRTYSRLERENLVVREARRGVYVASRKQSQTGNIGLLLHSAYLTPSCDSSYRQTVLDGIRESSHQQGFKIVLLEDAEAIKPQQIDGIIFYADKLEVYAMNISPQMPQIILFQHTNDINSVTADDFGGSKLATSHLIKNGHQRIACIMEETTDIPIQRRGGYLAAMQEAGITVSPDWLRLTEKTRFSQTVNYLEWGRRNMRAWLDEDWLKLGCTAIVAQNDHTAIGVMQTLQEARIEVPGQVSVIGFDGTDICDLAHPRLTSIEVPLHEIGREAIKVLCDQINTGSRTPREISLPVKLREGNSVAPINLKRRVT